jgi:hypothetical protein
VLVLKALVIFIFGLLMTLSESRTSQRTLFGNDACHGSTMDTAIWPLASNRPFTHTHTNTQGKFIFVLRHSMSKKRPLACPDFDLSSHRAIKLG